MVNGIRARDPRGLNKGRGSKFRIGSEFDQKHLRKAGGDISRNVVNITQMMKTIVRKHWMVKITKFPLRNSDN